MLTSELLTELGAIFPEIKIKATENDRAGKVVVYPKTEKEIAQIVKYCNDQEKTIMISAGGTKSNYGNPIEPCDVQLSLAEYKGIVEHTVGDMTVTVRPGTHVNELQDILAKHNQKLALDPAWPESATIGGVIAANDSGPKRLGYGTARDSVIGLKVVYPDGRTIRTGGKVVKNVAGYDMNKLFIGSMGTLGVISEITLKLRPLHKCESLVLLTFPSGDLEAIRSFAVKILDSMMEPIAAEMLNPALAQELTGSNEYILALSFEDVESSVKYQEEFVKQHVPDQAKIKIYRDEEASSFWERLASMAPNGLDLGPVEHSDVKATLKLGVINLDVLELIRECQLMTDRQAIHAEAHGGLATGICSVVLQGSGENVAETIESLRNLAVQKGGYAVVRHLPDSLRGLVDVWGEKPSHFPLLEGVKAQIDPKRILNPKRFVGGI